jgi:hypothetical protein
MNTIEAMREFLGWCSVINIGLLILATIKLVLFRGPISSIHAKMFNLDESDLSRAYLQFLAQYKIAILVFCVIPYFALRIMS